MLQEVGYQAPIYKSIADSHGAGIGYPWAAAADCQVHCLLKVLPALWTAVTCIQQFYALS